jgi:hypothetical protein
MHLDLGTAKYKRIERELVKTVCFQGSLLFGAVTESALLLGLQPSVVVWHVIDHERTHRQLNRLAGAWVGMDLMKTSVFDFALLCEAAASTQPWGRQSAVLFWHINNHLPVHPHLAGTAAESVEADWMKRWFSGLLLSCALRQSTHLRGLQVSAVSWHIMNSWFMDLQVNGPAGVWFEMERVKKMDFMLSSLVRSKNIHAARRTAVSCDLLHIMSCDLVHLDMGVPGPQWVGRVGENRWAFKPANLPRCDTIRIALRTATICPCLVHHVL